MNSSLLLSGGHLVDPSLGVDEKRDLLIEDGLVREITQPGAIKAHRGVELFDASGLLVTPGLIDLHVHLREPGEEWKETIRSGCDAALAGGYTTICAMPNTKPVNDNQNVTRFIMERTAQINGVRVVPIGAVSKALQGKEMAPLSELYLAGCRAFSDDGEPVWHSGLLRRALEWAKLLDVPIACHEEDKHLSCAGCMNEGDLSLRLGLKGMPAVAEEAMIARDIEIARSVKGKIHICHVSTARGVELIRRAKNDGVLITCEVTPHHLVLTEEAVLNYDTNAKMSPPLRKLEDCEALLAGLSDGTIDAIASDHAPHHLDNKQIEFSKASFGILGLQTNMPITFDLVARGKLSRQQAVAALSTMPAKSFKLEGGSLARGKVADITLIDPKRRWSFNQEINRSLSLNSPFFGREYSAQVLGVIISGSVKYDLDRRYALFSDKKGEDAGAA